MRKDGNTSGIISVPIYGSDAATVSDAAVTELIAAAQPHVAAILSRYRGLLAPEVLDDVGSTVMLRIVRRLRSAANEPIASFEDFVATITFNCVNDVLRDRAPERTQLKDRVRRMLVRSERLASWHLRDGIAAGFIEWRGRPVQELRTDVPLDRDDLEGAVIALLEANGGPLRLDAIVDALVTAWGVADVDAVPIHGIEIAAAADDAEARDELRLVLREIGELRLPQRQVLLLNLRDHNGASAIELFVLLGIATIDEIAAALEMKAEALATLWNSLPLDDNTIAARLGMTRQQVINLRRTARERLARRLNNTKR